MDEYLAAVFHALPPNLSDAQLLQSVDEILATEVLTPKDPQSHTFKAAIESELGSLQEKEGFEELCVSMEERQSMRVLKSRFGIALKNVGTESELRKAKMVVQALPHVDRDKSRLFTFSPIVSKSSFRTMLSLPASMRYPVWLRDITQAFVRS